MRYAKENENTVLGFVSDIKSLNMVDEDEYDERTFSVNTKPGIEELSNRREVLVFFTIKETATSSTSGDETVYTYKLFSKSRKDGNCTKATVDLLKRYNNLTPVGLVIGCKNCKIIKDYLVSSGILTTSGKRMDSSMRIEKVLSLISLKVEPCVRVLGTGNEVFFKGEHKKFENGAPDEDRFEFYVTASSRKRRSTNVLVSHCKRPRRDVV